MRLLFVALAFILVNIWIFLLWTKVSATRRGGLRVFQSLFPLKTLLEFISQGVERRFPPKREICLPTNCSENVTAWVYGRGEYRTEGARKYLYLTDHLGFVRNVVDANSGTLVGSLDYSPYGVGLGQRKSGSFTPSVSDDVCSRCSRSTGAGVGIAFTLLQ